MSLYFGTKTNANSPYFTIILCIVAFLGFSLATGLIYIYRHILVRLTFDTMTGQIKLNYLFKTEEIWLKDIKSYSYKKFVVQLSIRGGKPQIYQGDIIYFADRKLLISEFTLQDHRPFEKYLEDNSVPYNGEETDNTSFSPVMLSSKK